MITRTCNRPGNCVKCGGRNPLLDWKDESAWDSNGLVVDIGCLEAVCTTCGFRWRVLAKDERNE